ncbi:MAG: hypothetical protein ABH837_01875 [bacterium]
MSKDPVKPIPSDTAKFLDKKGIYLQIVFWGLIITGIIVGVRTHNWWIGSGIILASVLITIFLAAFAYIKIIIKM